MDKPAVIQGCYVDAKFMRGLKSTRVMIDIPIEMSNEFLKIFGAPDGANPVPVAIARLTPHDVPEKPEPVEPASEKPRLRSNLAAILVKENEAFQIWLAEKYPKIWDRYYYVDLGNIHGASIDAANLTLKEVLGIQSKRELDTDDAAAERFDKLTASFAYRNTARA